MTSFEPRVSIVTLGVLDLKRSRKFYEEGLGWKAFSVSSGDIVFFKTRGTVVALYPRRLLAEDTTLDPKGSGFSGVTLAHNVRRKEDVAELLNIAEKAGGEILKPAQDVFWGGHSGYFRDLDGHVWEVAWNPHFTITETGEIELP